MNKLSDEILNRYIDNDLDHTELRMVHEQLQNSEEGRKRLKALQLVHNNLKNIEPESVSRDFTSSIMKKIMKKYKVKKDQRYFIFSVSSIFVLMALGIIGYVISLIFAVPPTTATVSGTKETVTVLENFTQIIKDLLNRANISLIGSLFSLGLLISVYFIFDLIKHSKSNLSRQH